MFTPSAADLQGAAFLSLDVIPTSNAARTFIRTLAAEMSGKGSRKSVRRKPEAIRDFEAAVAVIVGGVLLNWSRGTTEPNGAVSRLSYRPMQAAGFTGQPVTHRTFKDALEALAATGHTATKAARTYFLAPKDQGGDVFNHRHAGRLWPTDALLTASAAAGMPVETIAEHFGIRQDRRVPVREPVRAFELGVRVNGSKVKGTRIKLPTSARLASITADVVAANEFAARQDVTFGTPCSPPQWSRVFGPDLDLHGRWYAAGTSYQVLPGATRASLITINGEPCAEVDVSGSHLTCLCGYLAEPFDPDADPYAVPGVPREVVKLWVTTTIGRGSALRGRQWPVAAQRTAGAQGLHLAAWGLPEVSTAVLERHPVLGELTERLGVLGERYEDRSGREASPAARTARVVSLFLMGLEAALLTEAMAELRERGVLALPVHDSLIVPVSAVRQAEAALVRAFRRRLGVVPRLKVGQADTYGSLSGPKA